MRYGLRGAICGVALLLAANGQDAFALPPGVAAEVVDLQGSAGFRTAINPAGNLAPRAADAARDVDDRSFAAVRPGKSMDGLPFRTSTPTSERASVNPKRR
jgi:hypothetical protein